MPPAGSCSTSRPTISILADTRANRTEGGGIVRSYRYLIVGGGMTADAACRGIRDHDGDGTIGLVSADPHPPYDRPPLSKALWQGKDEESIWRHTEELATELVLGRR